MFYGHARASLRLRMPNNAQKHTDPALPDEMGNGNLLRGNYAYGLGSDRVPQLSKPSLGGFTFQSYTVTRYLFCQWNLISVGPAQM
jgi:hypothetical protein